MQIAEISEPPACLDRLDPEKAADVKAAGRELRDGIKLTLAALAKFEGILFSPDGERMLGATDIYVIIKLFEHFSVEGYEEQDIPGLIGDRRQRSEKDIKKILGLLGLG